MFDWQLSKNNCQKNHGTSGNFFSRKHFVQKQPSAQYSKNRFQTHDQSRRHRMQIFLCKHLQCKSYGTGADTAKSPERQRFNYFIKNPRFTERQRSRRRCCGGKCKLQTRKPHAVTPCNIMIDHQNMHRKKQCANDHTNFADSDLAAAAAQQIRSAKSHQYRTPQNC